MIVHNAQVNGPATHVYIIGVGDYKYLDRAATLGISLDPVSAPNVSARLVADWFITNFRNSSAPLGTVELVASPADPYTNPETGDTVSINAATMANIRNSFIEWYERCNTDPNNIAIFYYCGHGLEKASTYLLPEDFGEQPLQIMNNTIDFDLSYRGMSMCQAGLQCYFLDCCRQVPFAALQYDLTGQALLNAPISLLGSPTAPIYYATQSNRQAFVGGQSTLYTTALLECLDGAAGWQQAGQWQVDTNHLHDAISRILRRLTVNSLTQTQRATSRNLGDPMTVHTLQGPPVVSCRIQMSPDAAGPLSQLLLDSMRPPPNQVQLASGPGVWDVKLPAGPYKFQANFSQTYQAIDEVIMVLPPDWVALFEANI